MLAELIESDPSLVDVQDDNGLTPLALVSGGKTGVEYDLCLLLLKAGANTSISDYENGWSPLHRALYFKNLRVALALVKAGAVLDDVGTGEEIRSHRAPVLRNKEKPRSLRDTANWRSNVDQEGLSPLALLSVSLLDQLRKAGDERTCTSVLTFGKADFQLGLPLASQKTFVNKAKTIEPRFPRDCGD